MQLQRREIKLGQYFLWYNSEKRQYLSAFDFDKSVKENGYLSVEGSRCKKRNVIK